MTRKVVFLADPGIDGAFTLALALQDPELEVVGLAATAGNVAAEQATKNMQMLVEQIDPRRWPRLGKALPVEYPEDGTRLHGPGGLGGVEFPCAPLAHTPWSDKLIVDLVRQHPKEITLVAAGPLTVLARALDRDPELGSELHRLICLGGAWHEPGNASAVAEFHFYCDPPAARAVLRSGTPLTLIPLDVMRKVLLSPKDLLDLPRPTSRTTRLLRQIVPFGIGATSNLYGIEGFHLKDLLGLIALVLPGAITTRHLPVDVETTGELTRGMSVIDTRPLTPAKPNVELAVGVDVHAVREYIQRILAQAA